MLLGSGDISLEVVGSLTKGRSAAVAERLHRVAGLGFDHVTVDVSRAESIDRAGVSLLRAFVREARGAGGEVDVVDPRCRVAVAAPSRATHRRTHVPEPRRGVATQRGGNAT